MSLLYRPSDGILDSAHSVRYLSQRDLNLRVPVNFVTYAGVAATAACFSTYGYEDAAAAKCLSNLLVSGFRRLDVDLYWDATRTSWSLCPVELGNAGEILTTSASLAATPSNTATSLSNRIITGRAAATHVSGQHTSTSSLPTPAAGTASSADVAAATLDANPTPTTVAVGPGIGPALDSGDATLIHAGPYACSPFLDFALVVGVISAHMANTETDLNATTVTMILNLHAAAPASDPTGSAEQPDDERLPTGGSLLSSIISRNMSVYTYPFSDLLSQRPNLNASRSWFTVPPFNQPDAAFFETDRSGSLVSTPDGWPSESYIELYLAKRVLVGFGRVDPQMENYNFTADESLIFPVGYLESSPDVTLSGNHVASGCFFNPAATALADVNSSWAVSGLGSNTAVPWAQLDSIVEQGRSLVGCGITPILNYTLSNLTADRDWRPYRAFAESSIWSWGPGQPVNASRDDVHDYRCAALNSSSGFWQAADCSQSHHAACRDDNNRPYGWHISRADAPYDRVELGCGDNGTFDVPRTSLESAHLLSQWRAHLNDQSDRDDEAPLLWLNFNDLDVATCWVIGPNSSCPYEPPEGQETRRIVVPVVGGIIVFVLTGLTIAVKCAGNRQTAKRRRRRGDGGYEYEGVPS